MGMNMYYSQGFVSHRRGDRNYGRQTTRREMLTDRRNDTYYLSIQVGIETEVSAGAHIKKRRWPI